MILVLYITRITPLSLSSKEDFAKVMGWLIDVQYPKLRSQKLISSAQLYPFEPHTLLL